MSFDDIGYGILAQAHLAPDQAVAASDRDERDFVAWRLRRARWRRREINYATRTQMACPRSRIRLSDLTAIATSVNAAGVVAGFQDISDHALVTTDCRFDLRAHVIAGGLLPIHAPMLFDRKDMPV